MKPALHGHGFRRGVMCLYSFESVCIMILPWKGAQWGTFVLTFYFLNIWDYNYTAYGKWFAYPFFHVVTGLMPGVWQMSIASAWVPVLGSKFERHVV